MPLGTLDRTPPPFFKQGPSALSKLVFFSALALFLMVADARFKITQPVRAVVATALYPAQWLAMRPVIFAQGGTAYFESLQGAQTAQESAHKKLVLQAQRAAMVEQLSLENDRLRKLLVLREQIKTPFPSRRSAVRRGRPLHPPGDCRQGPGARGQAGLACD